MRNHVLVFLSLISLNCIAQSNLRKATPYANILSPEELRKQLTIIAGPDMEGRETATEGQQKAATYIENSMKETGLLPAISGHYQICYPVYRDSVVAAGIRGRRRRRRRRRRASIPADAGRSGRRSVHSWGSARWWTYQAPFPRRVTRCDPLPPHPRTGTGRSDRSSEEMFRRVDKP